MTLQLEVCSKERVFLRTNFSSITLVDMRQVPHEETQDIFGIVGTVAQMYGQESADDLDQQEERVVLYQSL